MSDRFVVWRLDDADKIKITQHCISSYDLTTECVHLLVDLFQAIGVLCIVCRPSGVSVLRRIVRGKKFSFPVIDDPNLYQLFFAP